MRGKMKKQSKLRCLKHHFKKRMNQRFGIIITNNILYKLLSIINNGEAEFLFRQSLTRTCFKIKYDDKEFAVIYNSKYKTFTTALPLEWVEQSSQYYNSIISDETFDEEV